jgi:hypothetical protein
MSGISFRELDPHDRYNLLCWVVVLRPIAFQRDIFALTRESHAQWLARVKGGNGAGGPSDESQ